jgi:predicted DNA-binding transcriptional regulator AlpA
MPQRTQLPPTPPPLGGLRLLQSHEVMALFGYRDRGAFWSEVRRAAVPHVRFNARRICFEEAAVRAWLESKTVGRRAHDYSARVA